jgi:16S rRNA (adenine1518-N6/adenine1519-N6)-dimethyltransferase
MNSTTGNNHRPKKSLGQNFLTSIPARIAIVEAGGIAEGDEILEIGPGKGFLTKALLETKAHVTALEKDTDLLPVLTEQFSSFPNFTLIEGDALTYNPPHPGYKLIANIPYYITGAILERYLSHPNQPSTMVVLVQKEVAERVCAKEGKESILSLSVKAYGDPKLVYRVNKGSFNPIPTVDSAVLQIKNISRKNFKNQYHEQLFFQIIKAGFAHKRKLLLSNLKAVFVTVNMPELFEKLSIPPKSRAEDLPLPIWLALAKEISLERE